MAKVLGVVGARLNSSRLPRKQLLDLAGKPLIERIFERLERVPEIDTLILATTADAYNRPLVDWARAKNRTAFAYPGDINDLIARIDTLVQQEDPDVVVYVCGDSPLIEPTTLSRMIEALKRHPQAAAVELAPATDGRSYIHEGFSVYRRSTWNRIVSESRTAEEREHVGSSMARFAASLATYRVAEEPVFASVRQRISVDTPSDYEFMAEVYRRWYAAHAPDSIVSLTWVIDEVGRDRTLAGLNAHVRQKAVGQTSMHALLVCQAGGDVGLGHLTRMLSLARALQDRAYAGATVLIHGEPAQRVELELVAHAYVPFAEDLVAAVCTRAEKQRFDVVVFDLCPRYLPKQTEVLLQHLQKCGARLIAVDGLMDFGKLLDLIHIPSFFLSADKSVARDAPISYGWGNYLLTKMRQSRSSTSASRRVLVLTGGGDSGRLGDTLPGAMDEKLEPRAEIEWVRGPYAAQPQVPAQARLCWRVHSAPSDLNGLMGAAGFALTVYGVSLFELLQRGVPTVVLPVSDPAMRPELDALRRERVALVADTVAEALQMLGKLMRDVPLSRELSQRAREKVDGAGASRLAERIAELVAASR